MPVVVRVVVLAAVLAGGCTFAPASGVDGGGGRADAGAAGAVDAGAVDARAGVGACAAVSRGGLVECFEFDDDLADGAAASGVAGAGDAVATGVVPADRAGSPAVSIGIGGSLRAPDRPAQDLASAYTLALWVRPDQVPATGEVQGLLDHEAQVAMVLGRVGGPPPAPGAPDPNFQARCAHTDADTARTYEYTAAAPVATWSLLACTWDGATLCALRWTAAGDHQRYCTTSVGAPAPAGAFGLAMGHLSEGGAATAPLIGALDAARVWSRALSADELCAEAGQGPGCLPCTACD